jgi:hypothetical protein
MDVDVAGRRQERLMGKSWMPARGYAISRHAGVFTQPSLDSLESAFHLRTATLERLKLSVIVIIIPIVEMNWTGGTLQRLKAGRQNGVLQKQKEHFAKVRARLQISAWVVGCQLSALELFGM